MPELVFENVHNEKLHEDVCRQIARHIIRGDLQPGMLLPSEAVLIKQFNVSRAVLREALRSLTQRNLVEMRQGKRTQVLEEREWNVLDPLILTLYREEGRVQSILSDVLWIRRVLEPEIAAETAKHTNARLVKELEVSIDKMEALLDDPIAFFREDMAFHNRLAKATNNRALRHLMKTISYLFNLGRDLSLEEGALPSESLDWHKRIYEEIKQGNVNGAREAMANHIEWKAKRISDSQRKVPTT